MKIVAGVALVILASGCTGAMSAIEYGPLGSPSEPGVLCTPVDTSNYAVDGFYSLNTSHAHKIHVRSVTLTGPEHIELSGSYLLPIKGNSLTGIRSGRMAATPISAPKPAENSTFQATPGVDYNLVLELRKVGDEASESTAGGIRMIYESDGKRFQWTSPIHIRLLRAGSQCPD